MQHNKNDKVEHRSTIGVITPETNQKEGKVVESSNIQPQMDGSELNDYQPSHEQLTTTESTEKKCDCHKEERQVCDICQGISTPTTDSWVKDLEIAIIGEKFEDKVDIAEFARKFIKPLLNKTREEAYNEGYEKGKEKIVDKINEYLPSKEIHKIALTENELHIISTWKDNTTNL